MSKRTKGRVAPNSYYSLKEVVQKISEGQVIIKPNAVRDAFQLFGWGLSDIYDAYKKLQPKHFHKTDPSRAKPGVYLDFYKATINGEKIYTHFYIDSFDNKPVLVINSLKRQQTNWRA
jgi:hypothetical protein